MLVCGGMRQEVPRKGFHLQKWEMEMKGVRKSLEREMKNFVQDLRSLECFCDTQTKRP